MSRRIVTILVVALLLGAISTVEQISVYSLTGDAYGQTQQILSDIRSRSLDEAIQKARALDQMWDERAARLEMMIDHSSTDEVRYALSRLIAALESEDYAASMIYASELEGGIEHVLERQQLTIQNLL